MLYKKNIELLFAHCIKSEEFRFILKKYECINEVLKTNDEIQKIKTEIEAVKVMNSVFREYYMDIYQANYPFFD